MRLLRRAVMIGPAVLLSIALQTPGQTAALPGQIVNPSTEVRPTGGSLGDNMPAFGVRAGYRVTLAADNFSAPPRFLETDGNGTVFVSVPNQGQVLALRDTDGDGVYDKRTVFLDKKPDVHGLCFKDGWLWYTQARTGEGGKARDTNNDGVADDDLIVFKPGSIPAGGGHSFRAILVDDDRVYVSVSDPGNMLDALDTDRKKVYVYDLDGSNRREFASGIRNTEKLRFRPGTKEPWGLDHGSDNFGKTFGESRGVQPITDFNPPEELNCFVEGGFYGHPFITGNRVPRPEYAARKDIVDLAARTTPPAIAFGAHWAGNGFTFLSKDYFPDHQGDLFAAFHGSWNSTPLVGYKVVRVHFDKQTGRPFGYFTVVSTLSAEGRPLARPVDLVELPDGSVLFSCDQTRKLFRITRDDTRPR
jgi:glucose/arabinose dehydrogenase